MQDPADDPFWIRDLSQGLFYTTIYLDKCRDDEDVVKIVEALRKNKTSKRFEFRFLDDAPDDVDVVVNFDPLLREIESGKNFEHVEVLHNQRGRLLPFYRDRFFQSLLLNPNVRSLALEIDISDRNTVDPILAYLDYATNLTNLWLFRCNKSNRIDQRFELALRRNPNLKSLHLDENGANVNHGIFHSLASSECPAGFTKLVLEPTYEDDEQSYGALQQYFDSKVATIQCLTLVMFSSLEPGAAPLLQSLSRSSSLNELSITGGCFRDDIINDEDGNNEDEDDDEANREMEFERATTQSLADFIRSKPNLTTLRLVDSKFVKVRLLTTAVSELLIRRDSPLRCFEMSADYSESGFWEIMTVVNSSARLEHLVVRATAQGNAPGTGTNRYDELIALLKVEKLSLMFKRRSEEGEEDLLLAAFRNNYAVQSMEFIVSNDGDDDKNWLTDENQARLEAYLDRNRKLAKWMKNPKLVPQELWSYAMLLALKAGANSLFQSLLALSGHGIGLRQGGRKRKLPQDDLSGHGVVKTDDPHS